MTHLNKKYSSWNILFFCWLVVAVSAMGSLFFSYVMEFAPCVLCWYQRICLFPLVIILAAGLFSFDKKEERAEALYNFSRKLHGDFFYLNRGSLNKELIQKYNIPGPRYTSYPTVPFWDKEGIKVIITDIRQHGFKRILNHILLRIIYIPVRKSNADKGVEQFVFTRPLP